MPWPSPGCTLYTLVAPRDERDRCDTGTACSWLTTITFCWTGSGSRSAVRQRFVSSLIPQHSHCYSPEGAAVGLGRLTPRQREIVHLLGEGKSTPCIAEQLSLSPNTVTFHRVRIRKALGLDSEWRLMRYAFVVRMSEEERE